jgi:hypothetical protein
VLCPARHEQLEQVPLWADAVGVSLVVEENDSDVDDELSEEVNELIDRIDVLRHDVDDLRFNTEDPISPGVSCGTSSRKSQLTLPVPTRLMGSLAGAREPSLKLRIRTFGTSVSAGTGHGGEPGGG